MTTLEQLGTYLASDQTLSPLVLASARLHLLDGVAAWVAGIGTAEGRALIGFRAEMQAGEPDATHAAAAVMTHCGLARLSEIDDIHLASMTTAGGIVVPAAITLAACLRKTDPAGLARAIVGGYDVMIRLGLACHGPTILYRGIWPTYFASGFGVTAVAARLMGLDARQCAHALAFALTLAAPGVGHHNAASSTRWLAVGLAARNGLAAARAARAGFTADLNLLDGNYLPSVYDIKPVLGELTGGLDQHLLMLDVSCKPWCAARQTMAATQALREIVARGVAPEHITEIEAGVLPPHHRMIDHGVVAGDRASHLTSLPYQMALGVMAPDAASRCRPVAGHGSDRCRGPDGKDHGDRERAAAGALSSVWPPMCGSRPNPGKCTRKRSSTCRATCANRSMPRRSRTSSAVSSRRCWARRERPTWNRGPSRRSTTAGPRWISLRRSSKPAKNHNGRTPWADAGCSSSPQRSRDFAQRSKLSARTPIRSGSASRPKAWTTRPHSRRSGSACSRSRTSTSSLIVFGAAAPPRRKAMGAGAADIIAYFSPAVALAVSKGVKEKMVATVSAGHVGWNAIVKADSPIKTIQDLAGKKVGISAKATTSDVAALWIADKAGVKFQEIPLGAALAPGLRSGQVDAVVFSRR